MPPTRKPTIVLVDDDATQVTLLTATLERTGRFETLPFRDPREALEAVLSEAPDGVITDLLMPEMSGLELVARVRAEYPALPVIVLTGLTGDDSAERAFEAGATDFVSKPMEPRSLVSRLDRALLRAPEEEVLVEVAQRSSGLPAILGSHPLVEAVRETVRQVATVPGVPALLLGESGTGKNLVARALHAESRRAHHRFVEVNCAALPENLLEAEIFGYERGAFTDAKKTKKGLAEVADRGTLFLDEIGTLTPVLQAKLLTFLESRSFRRVGGTHDIQVDLRIVAATNADLSGAVREGQFRDDLYYRLNVATINLPPLRAVARDIGALAEHFLTRAARDFGKALPRLPAESVRRLQAYDWPGNARELRNVMERALIFSSGDTIRPEDLFAGGAPTTFGSASPARAPSADGAGLPLGLTLDEIERRYIEATLEANGGDVGRSAESLGVTRKVLWARRKKHGLL